MTIDNELIDRLLKDYKKPEDLIGEQGLLKQLTKAIVERALQAELTTHLGYERHSPEGVYNRHGIGKAVQRASPRDRILVDERIGLAPVRLQPLRGDVQRLSKCRHAISPQ